MYRLVQFVILIISSIRYFSAPLYPDVLFMTIDVMCMFMLLYTFYGSTSIDKNIIIKHSTIFIIGFLIVYYQFPIDYIIGNKEAIHIIDQPYLSEFSKGLCLANIALSCFSFGYSMVRKNVNVISKIERITIYGPKFSNILSIICLLLFIITVDKNFLLRGYGIYDKGVVANECEKILQMSIIASFAIMSLNTRKSCTITSMKMFWRQLKTPIIVLFIYVLLISFSGSRYVVLRMMSVLFISYIYVVRPKIKMIKLLGVVAIMALLTTMQGLTRNNNGTSITDASKIISESPSFSPLTQEFAFSITTLHIATSNIPQKMDYNYGITFFPEFLFAIPGARTLAAKIFNIPYSQSHSTVVITLLGYGNLEQGGLGSSSIADIYISFGVWGVAIVFLLFGILIRYIEEKTYFNVTPSVYLLGISFCFYSQMLYLNRESLFTSIVGLPYILIIIYLSRIKKAF